MATPCAPREATSAPNTGRAKRRGPNKAAVAVPHGLIDVIWHLLTTGEVFEDLGDDYFERRRHPDRETERLVHQLEELGYTVALAAIA